MTSINVADALARDLQFQRGPGHGVPAAAPAARFHFALDFDSATSWPDLPYDPAAADTHYAAPARAALNATLAEAAHILATRAPAAFAFIDAQLDSALLRHSERLASAASASHRARVGQCLLTNLHGQPDAVAIAVEGLLHESIHQHLYRTERADGNFCDLAETPTFRSPWSGARLPLHSLVHASFVWFGLLTLWTGLAQTSSSPTESRHARERMAHCLFGFGFLNELFASPAFPEGSVDARVLALLRALASTATAASGTAAPAGSLRDALRARDGAGWPALVAQGLAHAGS